MPTITAIAPGHWLDAPAAASWNRMGAAGRPADGITDAGRTNAQQWVMWRDYLAGKLKATAAYPGTSKHETGNALDLADATLAWVRAHGAAFGWIKDQVRNEPWHVEYQAARDTHPTPAQEDDMPTLEEIDAVVRVAVAAEVAKVMRGNEFDLEVTTLPQAIAAAVLGAQITRGGLGPAALRDWIADTRIIVGTLTSGGGTAGISTTDLARIAKAVADEQARRLVT